MMPLMHNIKRMKAISTLPDKEPQACQQLRCDHSKRIYHWCNTAEYQYEYCPVCSHIRTFYFKSFWKRLKMLFKNDTL